MSDTQEQILALLEKSATAIIRLTEQLATESAARMAHRHVLGSLLARHDEDKLKTALEPLGDWTIQIIKRSDASKGFVILPAAWPRIGRPPSPLQPLGGSSFPSA